MFNNDDYLDTVKACSAQALIENRALMRQKKHQEREERLQDAMTAAFPLVEELNALVEETKTQNELLKKQLDDAKESENQAKKDAKRARAFSWITFIVATVISLAALVVSIFK